MKNIEQRYCIYSNSLFTKNGKEEDNKDHIIPLFLGGHDDFVVDAATDKNSRISNEIENKLANDFLIKMNRNNLGSLGLGHRAKKDNKLIIPSLTGDADGKKAKIIFDKASKKVSAIDVISESNTEIDDWKKISFSLNYKDSDFELFLRFAAKVALGSGYFLYKDYFVENTDHDELRLIMNGLSKLSEEERKNIKTRCYLGRWFSQKRDTEAKEYKLYSEICKSAQGSIVIIYPTKNSLCFHIGVVSEYIGMINVPAKTEKMLEKYKDSLGHIFMITKNGFKQGSLASLFNHLSKELSEKEAKS
jgi:hypothetical protein